MSESNDKVDKSNMRKHAIVPQMNEADARDLSVVDQLKNDLRSVKYELNESKSSRFTPAWIQSIGSFQV
jgi:hypothetical protein